MDQQHLISYDLNFTPIYRYRLEARFASYYLRHFYGHPYRRDIPAIGYTQLPTTKRLRRHHALYDAMFNILVRGYEEVTGLTSHASTGQMLHFLSRAMKSIDDSFEMRLQAGASLHFTEMMMEPLVCEKMDLLQAYLKLFGCLDEIMAHFHDVYALHYEAYAHRLDQTRNTWSFSEVLACAQFDSGTLLRTMLEIVALFNGHKLADGTLEDFYRVGMLGKFADDMVDLARDIQKGLPNLVYALVQNNPAELKNMQTGLQSGMSLRSSWWQRHCPITYTEFFEHVSFYISSISTHYLHLACDLILLPVVLGRDYEKGK